MLEHVFAREPTPDHAGNLALALIELRRYEAARGLAQRAVAGASTSSAWWGALGTAARLQGDLTAAVAPLRQAAILSPADAMLRMELALALRATGDETGARLAMNEARRLAPSSIPLRWADALAVPVLVHDERDAGSALDRFGNGVAELAATLDRDAARDPDALLDAAASASSYHLHYLPHDATALQCAFGDLIGRAALACDPRWPCPWRGSGPGGRHAPARGLRQRLLLAPFGVALLRALRLGARAGALRVLRVAHRRVAGQHRTRGSRARSSISSTPRTK
jgi:tetratricopeptide (TPR) repeat protein